MQLPLRTVVFAVSMARIHAIPSLEQIDHIALGDSKQVFERRQEYFDGSQLTCNGESSPWNPHLAPRTVCQDMINSLMDNEVRTAPRDHCYTEDTGPRAGSRCCVSWGQEVPEGTIYSDLRVIAQDILDTCAAETTDMSAVSGKQTQANIRGQCISVCLSSRPDGCQQAC